MKDIQGVDDYLEQGVTRLESMRCRQIEYVLQRLPYISPEHRNSESTCGTALRAQAGPYGVDGLNFGVGV